VPLYFFAFPTYLYFFSFNYFLLFSFDFLSISKLDLINKHLLFTSFSLSIDCSHSTNRSFFHLSFILDHYSFLFLFDFFLLRLKLAPILLVDDEMLF
jgi:hypothetical protein